MKKNRYNKKLKYRRNPGLIDDFDHGFFISMFGLTAVPTLILSFLGLNTYFPLSLSIGFTSIILVAIYKIVIKPQIYSGNITAYYRRDYKAISKINNRFFMAISFFISRFILFSIVSLIEGKSLFDSMLESTHIAGIFIAVIAFSLMIYVTFFNEKYTTIKEYSNEINYEMKFNDRDYKEALSVFCKRKDKEHNIKEFNGTYFDYDREPVKEKKVKKSKFIRREMREENERDTVDEENKRRL